MEIFERASRLKLRFDGSKGQFTTEDLWSLSLTTLDAMAVSVDELLQKEGGRKSFLPNKSNKPATHNDLRLEILKHIINVRSDEEKAREVRAQKSAMLSQLKELAAQKANEQLASQSLDDIYKKIAELEAQDAVV